MINRTKISTYLLATALVCFASGAGAFADTTVGTVNSTDCFPFLCRGGPTIDYQQVYSAAAFSGTQSISSLTFFFSEGESSFVLTGTVVVVPIAAALLTFRVSVRHFRTPSYRLTANLSFQLPTQTRNLLHVFVSRNL
jgi:hypothetical protein